MTRGRADGSVRPQVPNRALFDTLGLTFAPTARRRIAVVAAVAAITIEAVSLAGRLPYVAIGGVAFSWSLVPALVLAVACGNAIAGRQQSHVAAIAFGTVTGLALTITATLLIAGGHAMVVFGILIVVAVEELIYRLAVPAVAGGVLHRCGVPVKVARPLGFVAGGVWFVLLPGHRSQWSSSGLIAGFVAFALLAALVVYSSRAVLAAFLVHLCNDLLTTLYWLGDITTGQRAAMLATVLGLMVLAYSSPEHRRRQRDARRRARQVPSDQPNPAF